ncbi:glycosyltransferase family 8 protein [Selenomonas sp. KH1T6]|uniref:glycosyltransferase family 8 protein n=1 Tax=Selenomonas sp. KH1T6 TaxID=3158784 RepID=UPI0008A73A2A|nr:UDP-glucose:(galactosyl)LPS alpha-1,2-glucosyltransferase [Selenomonas ruminantium]
MDFAKFIRKRFVFRASLEEYEGAFHISFGISVDYTAQAGVLMTSIARCNRERKIIFHVFCDCLPDEDGQRVEELVSIYKNIGVVVYWVAKEQLMHIKSSQRYPTAIFYRLISAAVLYPEVEKLLYLDSDILCLGSLRDLAEVDFEEICMAARDSGNWLPQHKQDIGLPAEHEYFNSGVLYMNLQAWNQAQISEQAVDLLGRKAFSFPDQDALNILIGQSYSPLDKKYNLFYEKRTAADLPQNTVFLHFAGDIKPWHPWCKNELKSLWEECLEDSPWRGYKYLPRNYREKRLMSRIILRQGHYRKAIVWYWRYVTDKIKFKTGKIKK